MPDKTKHLVILTSVWLVFALSGTVTLIAYSNSGTRVQGNAIPPDSLTAEMTAGRFTLLMFVHPQCPCSRASISELSRLMAVCSSQLDARVYFFHPAHRSDEWSHTDLWTSAGGIPGVTSIRDIDGQTALSVQAETSGQVYLYDMDRKLAFCGGITAGRGHEGDNIGRWAIEGIVLNNQRQHNTTPVFGCTILESTSESVDHSKGSTP